ncbi:hypothetical protein BD413DRAFT_148552 [Trametes elegans]|nr:hypothetical protein BD413DRAFT_148552 [Trametes elegans]
MFGPAQRLRYRLHSSIAGYLDVSQGAVCALESVLFTPSLCRDAPSLADVACFRAESRTTRQVDRQCGTKHQAELGRRCDQWRQSVARSNWFVKRYGIYHHQQPPWDVAHRVRCRGTVFRISGRLDGMILSWIVSRSPRVCTCRICDSMITDQRCFAVVCCHRCRRTWCICQVEKRL